MKNKFLTKVLIISFCVISSMLIFSSNSLAFDFTHDNVEYKLPDLPTDLSPEFDKNSYFILKDAGGGIYLIYTTSTLSHVVYAEGKLYFKDGNASFGSYVLSKDTWSFDTKTGLFKGANFTFLYSKFDIYDGNDNVFFQRTPVGQLVKVVTLEEAKEIPLTIVGLAKFLIPLLICLISFWKGWQILSRILHRA